MRIVEEYLTRRGSGAAQTRASLRDGEAGNEPPEAENCECNLTRELAFTSFDIYGPIEGVLDQADQLALMVERGPNPPRNTGSTTTWSDQAGWAGSHTSAFAHAKTQIAIKQLDLRPAARCLWLFVGGRPGSNQRRPTWESIRILNPKHLRVSVATS